MGWFANAFTWWNGASWGTAISSRRYGEERGRDPGGNVYFQHRRNPSRRWVIYHGDNDASRVPPDWNLWLRGTIDDVPVFAIPIRLRLSSARNPELIVIRLLEKAFPVLYRGANGRVAHECIIDLRPMKDWASAEDVAKRLMDFGFHAPTMSFPVAGTLMIEPTESEPKGELDRFCEAMIAIREEVREIERGTSDRDDNPLKHAPHTMRAVVSDEWSHAYGREQAAFPAPWTRERKFWPAVARVESAYGDRHLVCSCLPTDAYAEENS